MSQIQINAFFNFCRVKVVKPSFDQEKNMVTIKIPPDERYHPVCHRCQRSVKKIHSYNDRMVRDLGGIDAITYLSVRYRTVRCAECGIVVEEVDFVDPGKRVTKRLANYILSRCSVMTIKEIAQHLDLDGKTVKAIHKEHLKAKFSQGGEGNPRLLAVDEISWKKQHRYLTVVQDNLVTGTVKFFFYRLFPREMTW